MVRDADLGDFGWVHLQILLQLLYLASHGGVYWVLCLDGLNPKELSNQCVVCLAWLY